MKTIDSSIISVNRGSADSTRLLVASILEYLIWRLDLIVRAHEAISIFKCHVHYLLRLSLQVIRLRSCASVSGVSPHYIGIEFPLWVRACCYTCCIHLWRRRMASDIHLYSTRVEVRRCLVHEVLGHSNSGTSRTH